MFFGQMLQHQKIIRNCNRSFVLPYPIATLRMPPFFSDSGEPDEIVTTPAMKKPASAASIKPKPKGELKKMKKPVASVKKGVVKDKQPETRKEKGKVPTVEATMRMVKSNPIPPESCDEVVNDDPTKLNVGSVCSGWCSELFALRNLQIPFVSCFGCDNDTACRAISRTVHDHHLWYNDVTGKEFKKAPSVDFFFAGFPCQPFSAAGLKKGILDQRGDIIFYIMCFLAHERN